MVCLRGTVSDWLQWQQFLFYSPSVLGEMSQLRGGGLGIADGLSQKSTEYARIEVLSWLGCGRGYPSPRRLGGLVERRKLPQWGSGRSPGLPKTNLVHSIELSESHWWQ